MDPKELQYYQVIDGILEGSLTPGRWPPWVRDLNAHEGRRFVTALHTVLQTRNLVSSQLRILQDACSLLCTLPSTLFLRGVRISRKPLTRGGEAIIFHAKLRDQHVVARHVVPPPTVSEAEFLQTLHSEIILHSVLNHPNVISQLGICYDESDPDSDNTIPMVVLPFMESGSVRSYLSTLGSHDDLESITFTLMQSASNGLKYLHELNPPIIHGDIHPDNLLVKDDGEVALCDFGLSRALYLKTRTLSIARDAGVTFYVAPEIAMGSLDPRPTTRSDVFSMGMTFFFICSRKIPFEGEAPDAYDAARRFGRGERPALDAIDELYESLGAQTPSWFDPRRRDNAKRLIELMWDQSPPTRPQAGIVVSYISLLGRVRAPHLSSDSPSHLSREDSSNEHLGGRLGAPSIESSNVLFAGEESAVLYRTLSGQDVAKFHRTLTENLGLLAESFLPGRKRSTEPFSEHYIEHALATQQECVALYCVISGQHIRWFQYQLAENLGQLVWKGPPEGMVNSALETHKECVTLCRVFSGESANGSQNTLATKLKTLVRMSIIFCKTDDGYALEAQKLCVALSRVLYDQTSNKSRPEFAKNMGELARLLRYKDIGRAIAVQKECVTLYRSFHRIWEGPLDAIYRGRLAESLGELASMLHSNHDDESALDAQKECVGHYRVLADNSRGNHNSQHTLAKSLEQLASMLPSGGDQLHTWEESAGIYRTLASRNRVRFSGDLAKVLTALGAGYDANGRAEDGARNRAELVGLKISPVSG